MVSAIEEALTLRDGGLAQLCIGEVHGRKPFEFDFGNSPSELLDVALHGVTIAQRTSAGTQGIIAAAGGAERLYAASLVTAAATVRALSSGTPDLITLVAMGDNRISRATEDELCALHMRNQLEGRLGDPEAVRRVILAGKEAARFHDPARTHMREEDLEVALNIDRFNFAVRVELQDGNPTARMERPI